MSISADNIKCIFENAGITPTPVRILVYKCLEVSENPLSLTEIENTLESVDKSSISRTLSLFRKHNLIHAFNDGSGSMKYEIFSDNLHHGMFHVHFRCQICGATICLNDIAIPEVRLPEGFQAKEINYIVTGICADCANP